MPLTSSSVPLRSRPLDAFAGLVAGPIGWVAVLALTSSLGLVLVAVGFTLARLELPGAVLCFWVGVLVMAIPPVLPLLSKRTPRGERLAIVTILAIGLYLVKVMHSPDGFTFHDEFLHSATLGTILTTGRLFGENALLPTSATFPGLEIATSALVTLTGLSPFAAGVLVLGVLRVVIVLAVFLFIERVSASMRLAGLAALVYMANPAFVFFDAQFSYEGMALAFSFVVLAAVAARDGADSRDRARWTIVALVALATTIASHHLTAYALAAFLAIWALGAVIRDRQASPRSGPGWLAPIAFLGTASWTVVVAPATVDYLHQPITRTVTAIVQVITTGTGARIPFQSAAGSIAPEWERIVGIAAVMILWAGVPFGIRYAWQTRITTTVTWILLIAAAAYPFSVTLRLTSSGSEASTRLAVWLFLGVSLATAMAATAVAERHWRFVRPPLVAAVYAIVLMGGIISGWPPWARLPGPFLIGADTRSISPEGRLLAAWALEVLGPGNRFGADRTNGLLLGSEGQQRIVTHPIDDVDLSAVFLTPSIGAFERGVLERGNVHYVVTDLRLSEGLPQLGSYYDAYEIRAGLSKTPPSNFTLEKFDREPGVSRIFDSGDLRVHDVSSLSDGG